VAVGRLEGKTAIVTGSSSGIGRAIAIAFAREGANVVCADLQRSARPDGYEGDIGRATDAVIADMGGKVEFCECNVTKADQVQAAVDRAVSVFGRLDVMVNNVGVSTGPHTILEESEEDWDFTMGVNAKGAFLGCKAAIAQMMKQAEPQGRGSRGKVINTASMAGFIALWDGPSYCASKAAVVNLTRQVAVDFAPHRINVVALCPGPTETGLTRQFFDDAKCMSVLHAEAPWPDLQRPEDLANAAIFLASDESTQITGSCLMVEGGYTAR
jgi:NAD(P)-dependent dehydrogenase (short-subunit alcohol dehydrogenase family)